MDRTRLFFGDEVFKKVREKFVIVVGVGGVGSAAAHVLLRSGVGKLRLIDPDAVTLSSLNRNAVALRSDVGKAKVLVLKEHFHLICPETPVEAIEAFFEAELAPKLLGGSPDYVLDCIDNKETKVELLAYCRKNNIKIISSFGAGGATDPTKIRISDISDSWGCPFGKDIRRELGYLGVSEGITCVYSVETTKKKLLPLPPDELERVLDQKMKRKIRVRTIPTTMCLPSIAGTSVANVLLNDIMGCPLSMYEVDTTCDTKTYPWKKIVKDFTSRETSLHHTQPSLAKKIIPVNKVKKIFLEVWEGKSALSGADNKTKPQILRWRKQNPLAPNNLICVTPGEALAHEKVEDVEKAYPADLVTKIDSLLASVD
eukprot:TRINITY_DN535_c0_g1_i1.p1 TRINITY_DN535_c0_g1~~TRINITY_DN535_c0_g1_i1.p1  ORF type:complete len:427 (-),score=129.91 TRINITY_DN535_c0_g1_i1:29-1141(-)